MQIQVPETARANPLALAAAGCVALAAASLALPSEPTFGDPWIWIVWGRETVEGSLNTVTGSSWKPLPVILIAPTSLLGDDLVADAWLVIARAGFLGAIVLVHAIASRMAGRIAGLLSAGLLALTPFVLDNALRGYSEGLCALAVLGALHRFRADRHGQAFALAFAAGLLRPEAWPFLGLYGLWLWFSNPELRLRLVAFAALVPALWFLPEWWGSGDPFRAGARANAPNPGSVAFAETPSSSSASCPRRSPWRRLSRGGARRRCCARSRSPAPPTC